MNTGKRICKIEAELDEDNEKTNIFTKTNQQILFTILTFFDKKTDHTLYILHDII
jgi:hypothetical protein